MTKTRSAETARMLETLQMAYLYVLDQNSLAFPPPRLRREDQTELGKRLTAYWMEHETLFKARHERRREKRENRIADAIAAATRNVKEPLAGR